MKRFSIKKKLFQSVSAKFSSGAVQVGGFFVVLCIIVVPLCLVLFCISNARLNFPRFFFCGLVVRSYILGIECF